MEKSGNTQIKRILDILKGKGIFFVILLTVVFTVAGYFYSYYYVVPKYQAEETLLLIPNNTEDIQTIASTDLTLNSELISTYSSIAKQPKVLKQTIQNLNLKMTEAELLSKLQVTNTSGTYIIKVTVLDDNPQRATNIARELSNVFLNEIKQLYNLENVGIVDSAEVPSTPYNINHVKDLVMFFAAGIFVSGIVIVAIYLIDDTVKSEEDIEEYVELKTLGKVPQNEEKEEITTKHNAKSYITECINTIRTNILYMNSAKTAKTILITSCNAQEGKSFVSSKIAASFAETNKKVLIIDADMRKGRAEKIFKIESEEGLSNYLYQMSGNDKKDLKLAKKYIKETEVSNLHILTKGSIPPNPSELLNSNNMKRLLKLLKNVYDVIIIDSPPCKVVTDSVILSTITDSVILVVNTKSTKIKEVVEAKKSIKMVGGNLIGVILNKIQIKGKTYSKNYYYGHAKPEDKCEVVQKDGYTVKELFNEAISKFDIVGYDKIDEEQDDVVEEDKEIEEIKDGKEVTQNAENSNEYKEQVESIIKTQNEYLEKITNAIVEVKTQLGRNEANISDLSNQIKDTSYTDNVIKEINKEKLTKEQIEMIVKEQMLNVNYTNQFAQLQEMIERLNENYIELSDKLNEKQEEPDEYEENNEKVININWFRREKNKNKDTYSIDEDIPYSDLEKSAVYILPIDTDSSEDDERKIAAK